MHCQFLNFDPHAFNQSNGTKRCKTMCDIPSTKIPWQQCHICRTLGVSISRSGDVHVCSTKIQKCINKCSRTNLQFDLGTVDEEPLCGNATANSHLFYVLFSYLQCKCCDFNSPLWLNTLVQGWYIKESIFCLVCRFHLLPKYITLT